MTSDRPAEVSSKIPSVDDPALKSNRSIRLKWIAPLAVLVAAVILAMTPPTIVIDEIAVPKDLRDDGYTPQLLAARLASQIEIIRQTAKMNGRPVGTWRNDPTSNISALGAGPSLTRVASYLKVLTGRPDIRISGSVYSENGKFVLNLFGKTPNGRVLDYSSAPVADYRGVATDGAKTIVRFIDPFLLASYDYALEREAHNNDHPDTEELVKYCLGEPAVAGMTSATFDLDTRVRADNLWGLILIDQRSPGAAAAKFAEALRLSRGNAEISRGTAYIHANLAAALLDEKKPDEAIDEVRQALKLEPKYALAYYHWGNALRDLKRPDEAIAEYRKATELDPKDALFYNNWGNALLDLKDPDDAIAKYQKAIEIDPGYALAYNNWGVALRHEKKFDEAIDKYKKAIELDPKSALAYNNWGNALRGLRQPDQAIEKYRQAVAADPKYALAYDNWANVLRDLKQPEASIDQIKKAIELDPKSALAYNNWGNALLDQEKPEEAIEKYGKAVELDADYFLAYDNWGLALQDLKKPEEAIEKYQKAIDIDPNYVPAYNKWGAALRDLKRPDEAIEKYQRAVELDPSYAPAYNNWGLALRDLKRPDEAIVKFRRAVELDPKYAIAYDNWADALVDLKKPDEAIEKYRKAAELDPSLSESLETALHDLKGSNRTMRSPPSLVQ